MSIREWFKEAWRRLRAPKPVRWSDAALEGLRIALHPYNRRGW
jgi:hypothetical protein